MLYSCKGKKDGKFAYTLVPDKCKNASTNLITELEEIGIHLENQFVFAKKKGKTKFGIRGIWQNQWALSMLKCLTLQDSENIQQLQPR